MSLYCPVCFDNSIKLKSRGIALLVINDLHRDAGRFLYDLNENGPAQTKEAFIKKVHEFLGWYSHFENKEAISKLKIFTSDIICENKCSLPINYNSSIAQLFFKDGELERLIKEISSNYEFEVELQH